MNKLYTCAWLCLAASYVSGAMAQAPVLIIKDAWVRQTPGSDVAAVYLNLRNTSARPVIVIGVRSPAASHATIHETAVVGGQSQMRMYEKLIIAPGQTTSFAPGGLHIMLSGLKQNMSVEKSVPLVLLLADGGQVSVAALVKPLTAY